MNEFREALRDQANKNVSTELFSSTVMGIDSKLDALTTRLDRTEGSRAGSAENAAAASRGVNQRIAVMALGISVVVILVNVVIALIAHHV
jgi:hypothetical protein